MDWARRLKDYRSLNGLTQQALADDFGVDRTTVSRWERGVDEPSLAIRRRILALAPTHGEGTIRGLIDFIDSLDGMATLLDAEFRVLRTTQRHQQQMGYDPADLYGRPSERHWSAEMAQIIKQLGGLRGYRRHGVCSMDLVLSRQPLEGGLRQSPTPDHGRSNGRHRRSAQSRLSPDDAAPRRKCRTAAAVRDHGHGRPDPAVELSLSVRGP